MVDEQIYFRSYVINARQTARGVQSGATGFLTPADGSQDAVGGEVPTPQPSSQLAHFHVHQPLLSNGNCSRGEKE